MLIPISTRYVTEYKNVSYFQYNCHYATTKGLLLPSTNIPADNVTGVNTEVICGFHSASKITCNALARNSAGESPSSDASGYTALKSK